MHNSQPLLTFAARLTACMAMSQATFERVFANYKDDTYLEAVMSGRSCSKGQSYVATNTLYTSALETKRPDTKHTSGNANDASIQQSCVTATSGDLSQPTQTNLCTLFVTATFPGGRGEKSQCYSQWPCRSCGDNPLERTGNDSDPKPGLRVMGVISCGGKLTKG